MGKLPLADIYKDVWKVAGACSFLRNGLSTVSSLAVVLLTIFALIAGADAAVMVKLSLGDLAREADAVVSAKVTSMWSQWDESGTRIYTYVALEPEEFFKGDTGLAEMIVKVRGGIVGQVGQISPGAPSFDVGEDVVLFLKETTPRGLFSVVGLAQGKFSIVLDKATGEKHAVSNLSGIAFYDIAKRKIDAAQKSFMSPKNEYGRFRRKLIEAIQQTESIEPASNSMKR